MANTKSAAKRARQTTRRALRNRSVRSRLRGMNKRVLTGDGKSDAKQVRALISAIDKAAKRGIIHQECREPPQGALAQSAWRIAGGSVVRCGPRKSRFAYPAGQLKFLPMIPAFLLVLFVVAYRIAAGLPIHSGAALALEFRAARRDRACCGAYFPTHFKFTFR